MDGKHREILSALEFYKGSGHHTVKYFREMLTNLATLTKERDEAREALEISTQRLNEAKKFHTNEYKDRVTAEAQVKALVVALAICWPFPE